MSIAIAEHVRDIPRSGIRDFFEVVQTMGDGGELMHGEVGGLPPHQDGSTAAVVDHLPQILVTIARRVERHVEGLQGLGQFGHELLPELFDDLLDPLAVVPVPGISHLPRLSFLSKPPPEHPKGSLIDRAPYHHRFSP